MAKTDWTTAVRANVEATIEARRAGRARGERLRSQRPARIRSEEPGVGWLLRHPADHYLLQARARIVDPWICAHLDDHIRVSASSYAAIAAQNWRSCEHDAGLVVEVQIPEVVSHGWKEPVRTNVVAVHSRGVAVGSELPMRLVADPDAVFNGLRIAVRPGERWRLCATALEDGTVLPEDGTRRVSRPDTAAVAGPHSAGVSDAVPAAGL
jgi:hypothetical protein